MQGNPNLLRLTFTVEVEVPTFEGERDDVARDFEFRLKQGLENSIYFYPHHVKRVGVLDTPVVLDPPADAVPQVINVQRAAKKAM